MFRERAESLSAWWKPVDGGSNPPAPTLVLEAPEPVVESQPLDLLSSRPGRTYGL
jgi:hypothetical protein